MYPIQNYDDCENMAKGEIKKFNYVESCRGQHKVGDMVYELICEEDDYDGHWVHLGRDWFKLIHKSYARSC